MEVVAAEGARPLKRRSFNVGAAVFLITLLSGLFFYKWTGSFAKVQSASGGGWALKSDALTTGGMLQATLGYFSKVWIALVFGILIGAALRALISPKWVATTLSQGSLFRRQATGGLSGMPLMLCSCCVTPVFAGVYECGARLGPALSLMLAAPGLNIAALALTFLLFPMKLAVPRLVAALIAVFALPPVLEKLFGGAARPVKVKEDLDDGPSSPGDFAVRFLKSVGYLTVITIPLMVVGVGLSSVLLPLGLSNASGAAVGSILLASTLAVVVALPTFFEIPLAMFFLELNLPGAAAAMLFAGPIVNLPSLLVLGRETHWKVALWLAVGVWVLSITASVAASLL